MNSIVLNGTEGEAYQTQTVYSQINRKRWGILITATVVLCIAILVDLAVGPSWLNGVEIFNAITAGPNTQDVNGAIVWSVRLPMTLMCLCVGASLGVAGNNMQTVLGNPLASPYTLGISAAAGFGASVAIFTGVSLPYAPWLTIPICAFAMAMLGSVGIFVLGKIKGMHPTTMVLAGIVVHFFFQALQSLVQFRAAPEISQRIVFWMFGSLLKASWIGVAVSAVILLISCGVLWPCVWQLTVLTVGDERAKSLGIKTDQLRFKVFLVSAFLTTGAVAFVGTIGFIGLVAPHIGRMLVGEDQRYLGLLSAVIGILIMVCASVISKVVIPGVMVPVGIITSLIGVPFLLYLLLRRTV